MRLDRHAGASTLGTMAAITRLTSRKRGRATAGNPVALLIANLRGHIGLSDKGSKTSIEVPIGPTSSLINWW